MGGVGVGVILWAVLDSWKVNCEVGAQGVDREKME